MVLLRRANQPAAGGLLKQKVLLLLPAASYRNDAFRAAAARLGVEIIAAADYCHRLAPQWGLHPLLALAFDRPSRAAAQALSLLEASPDAVLAVDDHGVELAARLASSLGLPGNAVRSVRLLRDKLAWRSLLERSGMPHPWFRHLASGADPARLRALELPAVVKARRLAASRGVIRADTRAALVRAVAQVRRIQHKADRDAARLGLVIEGFIPGREYALEGLLVAGSLRVLALFDKPDPLDGPYFEETIFVTPSQLPPVVQRAAAREVERACRHAGLAHGPVHAEFRLNDRGIWLLEIAPRSIGGLCGSVLTHALGMTLEELILRHALGRELPAPRHRAACGVMMMPIPARGIFESVRGLDEALAVKGITGIRVTATPGQIVAPPPEGAGYLGFIFARGRASAHVVAALRGALSQLEIRIAHSVNLSEHGKRASSVRPERADASRFRAGKRVPPRAAPPPQKDGRRAAWRAAARANRSRTAARAPARRGNSPSG
jgi:biotin carboxylase